MLRALMRFRLVTSTDGPDAVDCILRLTWCWRQRGKREMGDMGPVLLGYCFGMVKHPYGGVGVL